MVRGLDIKVELGRKHRACEAVRAVLPVPHEDERVLGSFNERQELG